MPYLRQDRGAKVPRQRGPRLQRRVRLPGTQGFRHRRRSVHHLDRLAPGVGHLSGAPTSSRAGASRRSGRWPALHQRTATDLRRERESRPQSHSLGDARWAPLQRAPTFTTRDGKPQLVVAGIPARLGERRPGAFRSPEPRSNPPNRQISSRCSTCRGLRGGARAASSLGRVLRARHAGDRRPPYAATRGGRLAPWRARWNGLTRGKGDAGSNGCGCRQLDAGRTGLGALPATHHRVVRSCAPARPRELGLRRVRCPSYGESRELCFPTSRGRSAPRGVGRRDQLGHPRSEVGDVELA